MEERCVNCRFIERLGEIRCSLLSAKKTSEHPLPLKAVAQGDDTVYNFFEIFDPENFGCTEFKERQ